MISGQTTGVRVYNAIKSACLSMPEVEHFALWNNQLDKLKDGNINVFKFPAIFVVFENEYNQLSQGRQAIDGTFVLRIALQSLKHKDEEVLLFKDYVYQSLGKELPKYGFSDFRRRFELQDTDYDSLIVWQQEYEYQFIDDVAKDLALDLYPWSFTTDVHQ